VDERKEKISLLESDHNRILEQTLNGAVRTLEALPFTKTLQALAADDMATRQHEWRMVIGGVHLVHRADEYVVIDHGTRQRRLERELVLLRPLRLGALERRGKLDQTRERHGAGINGHPQRRLG